MTLRELECQFVKLVSMDPKKIWKIVDNFADAQGVMFLCPTCFQKNKGPVGTHSILCWSRSRGVPDGVSPGPGRWTFHGTGIDNLTLLGDPVGTAASVNAGCWHGFVRDGKIA